MFGKMGDMMGKLKEMQQQSEEVKKRLDTISVDADAENGMVKVKCTGNRKITSVKKCWAADCFIWENSISVMHCHFSNISDAVCPSRML